ncbi:hypothetical protein HanIR_Chr02g0081641 [Helianthus annuus]|nr:hypothetical protein HanIR_Chr02g0081641 [Helianthus annuus]
MRTKAIGIFTILVSILFNIMMSIMRCSCYCACFQISKWVQKPPTRTLMDATSIVVILFTISFHSIQGKMKRWC